MVQREYKILGLTEEWKKNYATNYMVDRCVLSNPSMSDKELFESPNHLVLLRNKTLLQTLGNCIRLIGSPRRIERSKAYLQDLLNGLPLIEL